MKQAKNKRDERPATVPQEELAYWRERISDKAIELWIDCHDAHAGRKACDELRLGTGGGTLGFDINESLIAALKLARTQFRAKEREASGLLAIHTLRKEAKTKA